MAVATPDQCGGCGKAATKKCGRCKNVSYCDMACQRRDWKLHKTFCDPDLFAGEVRPSPEHRRAILLPESGERPKLVWFEAYPDPDFTEHMGEHDMYDVLPLVDHSLGDGEHLDKIINVIFRDQMFIDGKSKTNAVLETLTKGKVVKFWKGPLLIYGTTNEFDSPNCVDLHLCDLGLAVNGLMRHAKQREGHVDNLTQKWGKEHINQG
ncbi:Tudor domain containing 1 [Elasticomyces elasticus]|nr:Tudor domain containing 1 [Elasticomyces elasticus]KAK3664878.1 Tudor domain containing 1 [Elasticomyces elasticus]KAK4912765.1 Tudor domain containing 1 [Elasticomyces elasticus]KAK5752161.1 Tudor domain containing 1 [Elasticomyces elasticus]